MQEVALYDPNRKPANWMEVIQPMQGGWSSFFGIQLVLIGLRLLHWCAGATERSTWGQGPVLRLPPKRIGRAWLGTLAFDTRPSADA